MLQADALLVRNEVAILFNFTSIESNPLVLTLLHLDNEIVEVIVKVVVVVSLIGEIIHHRVLPLLLDGLLSNLKLYELLKLIESAPIAIAQPRDGMSLKNHCNCHYKEWKEEH